MVCYCSSTLNLLSLAFRKDNISYMQNVPVDHNMFIKFYILFTCILQCCIICSVSTLLDLKRVVLPELPDKVGNLKYIIKVSKNNCIVEKIIMRKQAITALKNK